MVFDFYDWNGVRVLECAAQGDTIRTVADAIALLEKAIEHQANWLAIPAARLDPAFFQLRTGIAGEITQKFVLYGYKLAIVGDISQFTQESKALRDFILECNRGRDIWFLADTAELEDRISRRPPDSTPQV